MDALEAGSNFHHRKSVGVNGRKVANFVEIPTHPRTKVSPSTSDLSCRYSSDIQILRTVIRAFLGLGLGRVCNVEYSSQEACALVRTLPRDLGLADVHP